MEKFLRLGVIGLSEGNGHPYSWSAICNGYDPNLMEECGFPVIPRYLEEHKFPEEKIPNVKVNCIWTQDESLSKKIAKTCYIDRVFTKITSIIDHVDAVLLARDDAENHYYFAKPFLEAGLPVYIDKPLSLSVTEAQRIFDIEQYPGQIFTCSAFRYAKELSLSKDQLFSLGEICSIKGTIAKDWNRYAIHIIEPILNFLSSDLEIANHKIIKQGQGITLYIVYDNSMELTITSSGKKETPATIEVFGNRGKYKLSFCDTFNAFKNALNDFILGVRNKSVKSKRERILNSIKILELGRQY